MKNFTTIRHQDLFPEEPILNTDSYKLREAARAVVIRDDGRVALLKVGLHNYHKLPGGGIEQDEEPTEALSRELMEEIGCNAKVINNLGTALEYRDKWNLKQTSYCYIAKQFGPETEPEFTEEERAEQFSKVWVVGINKAISILESDIPKNYDGKFIQKRDLAILKRAEQQILALNRKIAS